jgi:hypothetical protein
MSVSMITDNGLVTLDGYFCSIESNQRGTVFHLVRGGSEGSIEFATVPLDVRKKHPIHKASIGDTYSYKPLGRVCTYTYYGLFTVDHFEVNQDNGDVTRVFRQVSAVDEVAAA